MRTTFSVTDYGSVADGKTKNTQAIRAAIEACTAAGGGRVCFPKGTYLTGPIRLTSHLDLHVEAGATVVFTREFADYPLIPLRRDGYESASCTPPLYGEGIENVCITGKGVFDGSGDAWRPVKKHKVNEQQWSEIVASGGVVAQSGEIWWPSKQAMDAEEIVLRLRETDAPLEDYVEHQHYLRPVMMCLRECRHVLLDGPTFQNPPYWTLHPLLCEDVTVRNVTVRNPCYAANGDGLNPDSCRNVLIEHCVFSTGDDCIAINSGKDEDGRRVGRPCENVTIRHCRMERGHGGVVIGSGMSGGVRDVRVHDCTFVGTDNGLRFKTRRGRGGVVEDIRISDITMSDIRGDAIRFNMYYMEDESPSAPVTERTPRFRSFHVSNVTCEGAQTAICLRGLPEMPIEAVTLENVTITSENGATLRHATDITLAGVRIQPTNGPDLQHDHVEGLQICGPRVDSASAVRSERGL